MLYPEKITARLAQLSQPPFAPTGNAVGTEANFDCGAFVRFKLSIDAGTTVVATASFSSNGCGYMLAAADLLAESVAKKHLADLHGLAAEELSELIHENLGEIPIDRRECVKACINALRSAFADFRSHRIEEFRGEKPLICTCFGVTEETIEKLIEAGSLTNVDELTRLSNAGSGCGSCRMLIQEIIDGQIRPLE